MRSGIGSLNVQTWNVANDTDLKLLFFDDDLWAQVHHSGLSCQQIRDKVNGVQAGQAALREGTNLTFNIAARSRPRYWYRLSALNASVIRGAADVSEVQVCGVLTVCARSDEVRLPADPTQ